MRAVPGTVFVQGGFSRVGGIETFVADLLTALRTREIAAELICWDAASKSSNPLLQELSEKGVNVYCSDWRWGCRWGWPDRIMADRCWKRMRDADVLVFGKLLHHTVHRRALSHRKRMVFITPYRPVEMWKEQRPDAAILNSFESIIVQASPFEEDLRGFGYNGQVVILPYIPPDVRDAASFPEPSPLRIGFLGRLVPDKNLKYLIVSFSRLRTMGVDAQLHIFGDGPERNAIQSLTNEMNLATSIQFHGNQDRTEIPAEIDSCHFFAFSSTTEGQCLSALEILARGRPVLGTPAGAFPEFLSGLLGSIAPLDDPTAFAAALMAVAKQVLEGNITPTDIQQAYQNRFPRQNAIEGYLRVFGCSGSIGREYQAK